MFEFIIQKRKIHTYPHTHMSSCESGMKINHENDFDFLYIYWTLFCMYLFIYLKTKVKKN